MAEDVVAQVVLRSRNGSSILDATEPITAETIARYRVGEDVIRQSSAALERFGFKVLQTGPTGLTISGSRDLFERTFDTVLRETTENTLLTPSPGPAQPRFVPLRPIRIPTELSSLVASVLLPTPPELMP